MRSTRESVAARIAVRLRDKGSTTVTDLARALDLSRTSIESAVTRLQATGLVRELAAADTRSAGRPARRYELDPKNAFVGGVDIGAHSVRVIIADCSGRVVAHSTHAGVEGDEGGAHKLDHVIDAVSQTLRSAEVPPRRLRALGVSLPGIVDDTGRVVNSVVIPEWSGVDISGLLANSLGCPVSIDNGVRLAAVAEHHLGDAQLVDDVLYVSVGNRVAVGLVLEGSPRRGAHHVAGDVGRLALRGLDHPSGQIEWASAATAAEVFALASAGDARAQAEIDVFIRELAPFIALVAMTVDPEMILIGGGLSLAEEALLTPLRTEVTRLLGESVSIPLRPARLGPDAPTYGALVHAFSDHSEAIYGLTLSPVPTIAPLTADGRTS
ncbi:MAG: ROK family transcriptional regulator [Microbacterium sp.]